MKLEKYVVIIDKYIFADSKIVKNGNKIEDIIAKIDVEESWIDTVDDYNKALYIANNEDKKEISAYNFRDGITIYKSSIYKVNENFIGLDDKDLDIFDDDALELVETIDNNVYPEELRIL